MHLLGSEMGGGNEENPKPRQLLLLGHQPGPSAAPAPPLHLIPLLLPNNLRASLPYAAGDATSTSRIQTRAAKSPGISRTFAYAIDSDHMDNTQLHLAIPREVGGEWTARKRTKLKWESTGPGKADQPPVVMLRSRTERDQVYTAATAERWEDGGRTSKKSERSSKTSQGLRVGDRNEQRSSSLQTYGEECLVTIRT